MASMIMATIRITNAIMNITGMMVTSISGKVMVLLSKTIEITAALQRPFGVKWILRALATDRPKE